MVILKELESACEPAFTAMSRISWSTNNLVSGQSAYVDDLNKALEQVVDVVRPLIEQKKYMRNFFDKVSRYMRQAYSTPSEPMLMTSCQPHLREIHQRFSQKQTSKGNRRGTSKLSFGSITLLTNLSP